MRRLIILDLCYLCFLLFHFSSFSNFEFRFSNFLPYPPVRVSYKIAKSGRVGRDLKRAAAHEIVRAKKVLARKARKSPRASPGSGVHEARKCIKKTRALLRLAKSGLGPKKFKRENRFFRDAAREIRAVRDAVALVEALDSVSHRYFDSRRPEIASKFRRILAGDARKLGRTVVAEGVLERTAKRLDSKLKRVKQWKLRDFKWKDAVRGRRRASKACKRAFEAARANPGEENFHEWRKRAKDFLHESLLLRDGRPKHRKRIETVQTLTAVLGEDRDIAMLETAAVQRKEQLGPPEQFKMLLSLLAARREELRTQAFALSANGH
jgi:hypothetical protein